MSSSDAIFLQIESIEYQKVILDLLKSIESWTKTKYNTRKFSCVKQEAYRPRRILSVACPVWGEEGREGCALSRSSLGEYPTLGPGWGYPFPSPKNGPLTRDQGVPPYPNKKTRNKYVRSKQICHQQQKNLELKHRCDKQRNM